MWLCWGTLALVKGRQCKKKNNLSKLKKLKKCNLLFGENEMKFPKFATRFNQTILISQFQSKIDHYLKANFVILNFSLGCILCCLCLKLRRHKRVCLQVNFNLAFFFAIKWVWATIWFTPKIILLVAVFFTSNDSLFCSCMVWLEVWGKCRRGRGLFQLLLFNIIFSY